jgi:hypothetical protein
MGNGCHRPARKHHLAALLRIDKIRADFQQILQGRQIL